MNISSRQMEAFAKVARLSSFTRAAEQLHITQSGLSALMRSLEEQFGTRLFDRTTRTVSLTHAGRELLPFIEQALDALQIGRSRVKAAADTSHSVLTVAATPMVASSLLPSVCAVHDARDPEVTVRIRDAVGIGIQELVQQGKADVGLGIFRTVIAGVVATPIMKFHLVCVSKPGTLKIAKASRNGLGTVAWSQLHDVPMLTLSVPDTTQQVVNWHLRKEGHSSADTRAYDSLHTVAAMAAAGYGVAVIPSFALAACQRYGAECARMVRPSATVQWLSLLRKGGLVPVGWKDFQQTLVQVAHELCGE